jgi:hypothetical protein
MISAIAMDRIDVLGGNGGGLCGVSKRLDLGASVVRAVVIFPSSCKLFDDES